MNVILYDSLIASADFWVRNADVWVKLVDDGAKVAEVKVKIINELDVETQFVGHLQHNLTKVRRTIGELSGGIG